MQNQKNENKEVKKKKNQKAVLITTIVTSVVIIAGLITAIVLLLNQEPELPGPVVGEYDRHRGGRGTVVTEDNVDEIRQWLEEPIEDGQYRVHMSVDWTFPTSRTPSENASVTNLETNTRTVFFELYLEDTGEVIYVSPYIPLGSTLANFALDANLSAGEYTALMTFFLVDDDYEIITTVSIHRTFTVLA